MRKKLKKKNIITKKQNLKKIQDIDNTEINDEKIEIEPKILDIKEEDIEERGNSGSLKESLYMYFDEIRKERVLTEQEEKKLIYEAKRGDENSRAKLIKANLKLVVKIAKNYENFGIPLVDLIEEGNIGLMRAIDKFSLKKGFRFSTYATWWIRQSIYRAIANQKNIIRIPIHILDIYHKYLKFIERELKITGNYPSRGKILNKLKIDEQKLNEILNIIKSPKSLDLEYEGDESEKTLKDTIEDKSFSKPDDDFIEKDKKEKIIKILDKLKPKEQRVIILRYGLDNKRPLTLEEVGKKLKLTRERIRQIEEVALRKLKVYLKNRESI